MVKNLPADVRGAGSIPGEDPLEKEMTTHPSILAWRISMDREAWQAMVHGVTESDTAEELNNSSNASHALFRLFSLAGYIVPCATQ